LERAVSNLFEFLDVAPHKISSGKRAVPERLQSGIEFRGVSFRYPGTSEMVLQDLNLFLKAGECVALVGHNGAGKTTLVKLLTRLYEPTAGQILLDSVCHWKNTIPWISRHVACDESSIHATIGTGDAGRWLAIISGSL
jgi:ATP-binding cassette, subfamily B, bacterial